MSNAAASKSAFARTFEVGANADTRKKSSTAAALSPDLLFCSPCL